MIKKVIATSIIVSGLVSGVAFAQTSGDAMMKKDEGAMMKKEDSAMMMKKEEGAMMKKGEGVMMKKTISTTATSAEISDLQSLLVEKGFLVLPEGVAKGYFGKLTKSALIKYQKANGLSASGYFGPLTKAKLAESKAMMKKEEGAMMMKKDDGSMMKKEASN